MKAKLIVWALTEDKNDGSKHHSGGHLVILDHHDPIQAADATVGAELRRFHPKTKRLSPDGTEDKCDPETYEGSQTEESVSVISGEKKR